MAIVRPMYQDQFEEWVESRPEAMRPVMRRWPPDRLYRMKPNGHRVTICSYSEDGTVTVDVSGEYNRVLFGRRVFGVAPDDLEECDLPGPDEDVGDTSLEAGYTEDDIRNILIPKLRDDIRSRHPHTCGCAICGAITSTETKE